METTVTTPPRRHIQLVWVERLFRDLTEPEKYLIRNALGDLPLEPSCGTQEILWQRAEAGEVGLWICRDDQEQVALVTFYEVETFCDGTNNFVSLCTLACGAVGDRRITDADMPQMEALARRLGCRSMSMRTIRPGLVKRITAAHGWFCSEVILRKIL